MSASPLAPIAHSSTAEDLWKICRDICAAAALERVAGSGNVYAQLTDDVAELLAVRGMKLRASPGEAQLVVWS